MVEQVESAALEGMCLRTGNGEHQKSDAPLMLNQCHYTTGNDVFIITKRHEVRARMICLDAGSVNTPLRFKQCHGKGGSQKFVYKKKVGFTDSILIFWP